MGDERPRYPRVKPQLRPLTAVVQWCQGLHLGDLSEAILATGYVSGELLGEPGADLRAKMADTVVRLFTPYLSM
jgi:hypothetical protein